jgi:hypothetical protein
MVVVWCFVYQHPLAKKLDQFDLKLAKIAAGKTYLIFNFPPMAAKGRE